MSFAAFPRPRAIGLLASLAVLLMMQDAAPQTRTLKIVALGTSLTARGGWQPALEEALARCLSRPVEIATVAKSGATSDWAAANVGAVVAAHPDVVLVEFYANDAALNRFTSVARSRANMEGVLDTLRSSLPRARIVLMGMNPMHGLRGTIRPFIESYAEAHRTLALSKALSFVDFRPIWRRRGDAWLSQAIPDGTHPTPAAAAEIMVPTLVAELSGGPCAKN